MTQISKQESKDCICPLGIKSIIAKIFKSSRSCNAIKLSFSGPFPATIKNMGSLQDMVDGNTLNNCIVNLISL
jgi:hypothetical protein